VMILLINNSSNNDFDVLNWYFFKILSYDWNILFLIY
jgi:hypothetical protein